MRWLSQGDPGLEPSAELAVAVDQVARAELLADAEPYRQRVIDFAVSHPDAAQRSCQAGHFTGSAVVVDPERGQTLLMLHRKLGRWFQPGGHADGDANLAGVAWKEATEESGIDGLKLALPAIDLDVHSVPLPDGVHLHFDLRFLVLAPAGAEAPGNHESLEVRWVDESDLDGLGVDLSTRRLVWRGLGLIAEHRP